MNNIHVGYRSHGDVYKIIILCNDLCNFCQTLGAECKYVDVSGSSGDYSSLR